MNTETTNNQPSNIATLPAPTAPKTSREVIQANVDLLIQQLEAGHSEGLTAYLTAVVFLIIWHTSVLIMWHTFRYGGAGVPSGGVARARAEAL